MDRVLNKSSLLALGKFEPLGPCRSVEGVLLAAVAGQVGMRLDEHQMALE